MTRTKKRTKSNGMNGMEEMNDMTRLHRAWFANCERLKHGYVDPTAR